MSTLMEHNGRCSHKKLTKAVSHMIGDTCLIIDVEYGTTTCKWTTSDGGHSTISLVSV
jgi:hypothetical protein